MDFKTSPLGRIPFLKGKKHLRMRGCVCVYTEVVVADFIDWAAVPRSSFLITTSEG